jgi:hypothetical protein
VIRKPSEDERRSRPAPIGGMDLVEAEAAGALAPPAAECAQRSTTASIRDPDHRPERPLGRSDWRFANPNSNLLGVFLHVGSGPHVGHRDPNTFALAVVWICNECVAQMEQTLAEEHAGGPWLLGWEVLVTERRDTTIGIGLAVPLACHIGRSITVSSGQPRSLPSDHRAGRVAPFHQGSIPRMCLIRIGSGLAQPTMGSSSPDSTLSAARTCSSICCSPALICSPPRQQFEAIGNLVTNHPWQ